MENKTSLAEAVSIMGGVVSTSRLLGLNNYQTVQSWLRTRVPAEYCLDIERATMGEVTREALRPDVFL